MFKLIDLHHEEKISDFVNDIQTLDTESSVDRISQIIQHIYADIPDKKRISYGRYSIIKKMGICMYPLLEEKSVDICSLVAGIFDNAEYDQFVRSFTIQLLSIYGQETGKLEKVLPLFEQAAVSEHWEMRECSAGFIHKLVKKFPEPMHKWYLKMVKSANDKDRRFASESLRPVSENRWLHKNPKFAFSILEHLYTEPKDYPRTSVGNNLSDWMRVNQEVTLPIVKQLAANGDKNSYWIAYRACRNLVKKDPLFVMDMLKINQYIYKDRNFKRDDYL